MLPTRWHTFDFVFDLLLSCSGGGGVCGIRLWWRVADRQVRLWRCAVSTVHPQRRHALGAVSHLNSLERGDWPLEDDDSQCWLLARSVRWSVFYFIGSSSIWPSYKQTHLDQAEFISSSILFLWIFLHADEIFVLCFPLWCLNLIQLSHQFCYIKVSR